MSSATPKLLAVTANPGRVAPDFRSIYDEYFGYVWTIVVRFGVLSANVEDVVHEVFVTVHKRLDDYDTSRPFKPWLAGIAFRTALDFARRAPQRREVAASDHLAFLEDEDPRLDPELAAASKQEAALVHCAIQRIDDSRRAVFILHELEGVAVPDVAQALSIPLNTAYSRLRLAREEFGDAVRKLARGEAV